MGTHQSVLGGVALVLALTVTSCSDETSDPDTRETPSATPSTTPATALPTSTPTPKTDVEKAAARLQEYLKVRDAAYRDGEIDLKVLDTVATGDEYLRLQAQVLDIVKYDLSVRGRYEHALDEARARGDGILIIDCEDRSSVDERNPDGSVIKRKDPNGGLLRNPVPVEYELVKPKSQWLVTSSDVLWDQPC